MVKFKCKNCGRIFEEFCDSFQDSTKVQCPSCSSHWVENVDRIIVPNFPVLPYTDLYIKPTDWTITCRTCDIHGN